MTKPVKILDANTIIEFYGDNFANIISKTSYLISDLELS